MYLGGHWPLATTNNFQSQLTESIKRCSSQRFTVLQGSGISFHFFEFYVITDLTQNLQGDFHLGPKQAPSAHVLSTFWEKQWYGYPLNVLTEEAFKDMPLIHLSKLSSHSCPP